MSKPIIKVENLSKQYRIGAREERHDTFRDSLAAAVKAPFQRFSRRADSPDETVWALKDINFEVQPGEVVGIIGRNGAGKSTLLKVLSRITEPTTGSIKLYGRIASLLEVGTGFHPELTGRENIYLNGAILGMARQETERKFDEIIAFAGVEKFINTPVKRYSSGMYLRLAFAVAAHLEPEVLIVDEVLAVGDASFQKKCLGKMKDVSQQGKTVLFVSHNLPAIQSLCDRGIYLKDGTCFVDSSVDRALEAYHADIRHGLTSISLKQRTDRTGSGRVRIYDFYIKDKFGATQTMLESGEDYVFVIAYETQETEMALSNIVASIGLRDDDDTMVFLVRSNFTNQNLNINGHRGKIECYVEHLNLASGAYTSVLFLSHGETEILDFIVGASEINIQDGDFFGTGSRGLPEVCKTLTLADWSAA